MYYIRTIFPPPDALSCEDFISFTAAIGLSDRGAHHRARLHAPWLEENDLRLDS